MKALITAFALLSFVAATTIPYAAQAQTQTPTQTSKPMAKKAPKKHAAAKKHHKTAKKKTKSPGTSAKG